ncbi:MAG: HD domain-containing protein [Clostridiales bacterium]|nr:HD domain-containing protein [Clostridiales bacterium]
MKETTPQVVGFQNVIACTVADLLESRDNSTGWHVSRTQKYLKALVSQLYEDDVYSEEILSWNMDAVLPSAQLHDVGKISISDAILNKPGKLAPEEFEIMKTHVQRGVEAIEKMERFGYFTDFLECAKTIVVAHHEKWDGSGYPFGLSGLKIPLLGRLMAVVDVYDALTSVRPYKAAFSAEESAKIIIDGAGTHFDPAIIGVFVKLIDEFAAISSKDI